MIQLQNLKATNFLSFRKLEVNFKKGLFLIDGFNHDENTSNGAGKSAVIDAICFSLYGDLPRKVKFDEVVSWGESNLDLQLSFTKAGKHYFIHRSRNPNILNFYVDTALKNGRDSRETQQIINKSLGLGLDTFLRSVYYSQNTDIVSQFLFANDEEKKDVLTELLDLYIFDDCLEKIKRDNTRFVEKKNEATKTLGSLQRQIKEKQDEAIRLQRMFDNFEDVRKEDVKKAKAQIKSLIEDKSNTTEKYKKECELSGTIDAYQIRITELNEKIDLTCEDRLSDFKVKAGGVEKEIQLLKKQLKQYDDLVAKGKCPTCGQDVTGGCLDTSIKPLTEKISKLTREKDNLAAQIVELDKVVEDTRLKKKEVMELTSKIMASQTVLKKAKSNYDMMIKNIDRHISDYEAQLEAKQKEVNNYGVLIKEIEIKVQTFQQDVEKNISDTKEIDKYLAVYERLMKAFSREGVKAYVFAKVINEVNYYVSDYLSQMFDANISLKFDIEKADSQGNIKQKIDTILIIDGERRNINILSGGERAKLMLATNFALSKIISSRCSSMPNFICLDECFTGLDNYGKEKVMLFLKKLSESKDFVFVIDHQTEFKNMFDGVYTVQKKNGISEVNCE